MTSPALVISQIETFGTVDGPGLRTVFFLQGCAMRCLYCHNPETQDVKALSCKGELRSFSSVKSKLNDPRRITLEEILTIADRYKSYYGDTGGLTFSGGDPLLQTPALLEIFPVLKEAGFSICLDTAGVGATAEQLRKLLPYVDYLLLDLKAGNDALHRKITGLPLSSVRTFHEAVASDAFTGRITLRYVAIPGLTDDPALLPELVEEARPFAAKVEALEVLPYHTMGENKYEDLGMAYGLDGVPAMDAVEAQKLQSEWRRIRAESADVEETA